MSLLKHLFGGGAPEKDPDREMSRLAALLATEIRLYNQAALEAVSGAAQLPDRLAREVSRAYQTYSAQVGLSEESEAVFCREFAAALTQGNEHLVKSALQVEPGGSEPLRPS